MLESGGAPDREVTALLAATGLSDAEVGVLCHRCVFELHDVLKDRASLEQRMPPLDAVERCLTRLAAADPGHAGWQRDLSVSHNKMGGVLVAQGNLPGALDAFRRSLTLAERLAAADPSHAGWQRDLSVSHERIGDMLVAQGNLPGALDAFRRSLTIRERLAAADPSHAGWQRDLSLSHNRIGDVLVAQGNLPGALDAFRRGHTIFKRLAAADPSHAGRQRDLGASHHKLGGLSAQQGDAAQAQTHFGRCVAIFRGMEGRGMHLDPAAAQVLDQLEHRGFGPGHGESATTPPVGADIPTPHPAADPDRAARLNLQYQRDLQAWHALPWWRRVRVKKPEPLKGI